MCISAAMSSSHLQRMRASGFAALKVERGGSGRDRILSRMCQCGEPSHTPASNLPHITDIEPFIFYDNRDRNCTHIDYAVHGCNERHADTFWSNLGSDSDVVSLVTYPGPPFTRLLYNPLVSVIKGGMLIS